MVWCRDLYPSSSGERDERRKEGRKGALHSVVITLLSTRRWRDTASQFCRGLCLVLWGPMVMGAALYHGTDKEPAEILA